MFSSWSKWFDFHSLPAQMAASFVALVLLTSTAAGLPAIWLTRRALEQQAWERVHQGELTTRALYADRQAEIEGLVTLTAQRPKLWELLAENDADALAVYLETLRRGAELDVLRLCDAAAQAAAASADLCALATAEPTPTQAVWAAGEVWLAATYPLDTGRAVLAARRVDRAFAATLRAETGLEHTFTLDGRPVASSLPEPLPLAVTGAINVAGVPYYVLWIDLDGGLADANGWQDANGLQDAIALDVRNIAATQQRLVGLLGGGILSVVVIGSWLGLRLARRMGAPLLALVELAETLERDDRELSGVQHAREIALVARALQTARGDVGRALAALSQEKAWADHLLEAIVEGIATLDAEGRITFFSPGAERITGWQREEAVGQACAHVFSAQDPAHDFAAQIPPPGGRSKVPVLLRDGRAAVLAVTRAELLPPGDDATRVALVFRDVSEEESLHRLVGHFLANITHEFRTPLAALAASVELLRDQAPTLSPAELRELLNSVHLSVLDLQTLVDNLLESASIEAGRFHVFARPCRLRDIIVEARHVIQPLLDKHGQQVTFSVPEALPPVRADFRRTVQVLVNLLDNASKYGTEGGRITLVVEFRAPWVRVAVTDDGTGIPLELRRNLFRRFSRLEAARESRQAGAGLGLSVVKAIVEAQGGEVGVQNASVGGGTCLWFTLEVADESSGGG